jgi:hypothetical protein
VKPLIFTQILSLGAILGVFSPRVALAYFLNQPPETKVNFVDRCNAYPTGVTMPGGTSLMVKITGLLPDAPISVKITLTSPTFANNDSKGKEKKIVFKREFRHSSATGKMIFSQAVSFDEPGEQVAKSYEARVWNAQVDWNQGYLSGEAGHGFASIYVIRDYNQRFYKIRGPAICHWETPPSIVSEYHYNSDPVEMNLTREYLIENSSEMAKGVDVGMVPDYAGGGSLTSGSPLIVQNINELGWIYAGVRSERSLLHHSSLSQTWTLSEGQGGFFSQRLSFSRVPADEFMLDKTKTETGSACPRWRVKRSGLLDIGLPITEFTVVPRSMSGSPNDAAQFLEKMRPTLNTCGKIETSARFNEARVPGGSEEDMMFFFPSSTEKEVR